MTTTIRRASHHPERLLLALIAAIILISSRGSGWPSAQGAGCGAQANPVACENALPGDNDWDLSGGGIGDPTIQGYASDFSVNAGETVNFKIMTDAAAYDLDIYRLGYYGGAGGRKVVSSMVPSATLPQTQPACINQAATGLLDCGNWAVSAAWSVPPDAASGVYVARLHRADTGGQSHIVFIVRQDARPADVLFQTSDTTWQAYNRYGGGSTYCAPPGTFSNAGTAYEGNCSHRAVKVSYNRPFDTRVSSNESWLFSAEYPMIRFLEANGYDVKYWSGVDTDRRGLDLVGSAKPKAFLSVGHDEYWSGMQRGHVEAARAAGVNLAFFSGNEVYWKTRWESSIDGSGTPHKTLVVYKETLAHDKIDPLPGVWTGTWRDTRFASTTDGGRPENALIGSIWTVNRGTFGMEVPEAFGKLRFWRNTQMATLQPGQIGTIAQGTLGYEWGENLDNGFRPAGVINLSTTTLNVPEKILDFGTQVGPGVATHSLTLYRHNTLDGSGNVTASSLVFGASTVQFAWGLDPNHDGGPSPTDPALRQVTVNLLADMGAQPGLALQAGLVSAAASTDTIAPSSTVTFPLDGATVSSGSQVVVQGTASDLGGLVAGVEVSVDGGQTWHAATGRANWTYVWVPGAVGAASIMTRATDDSANQGTPGPGATVTIAGGVCPCTSLFPQTAVPAVIDGGDPDAVEVGVKFKSDADGFITGIRFYKAASNNGTHIGNLWSTNGTPLGTAVFTNETSSGWQQVSFPTPVAITANTTYIASYHSNVGHYSFTSQYFLTTGVTSPPLHAETSGVVGGNGVYSYGVSQMPVNTFGAANYWVDVVYAPSLDDEVAPSIFDIRSQLHDSSRVTVQWTTNEEATSRIDVSTDAAILQDLDTLPPGSVTLTDTDFKTLHALQITSLQPNTTYYYRVTAVDRAGNSATATAPSFTVPGPTLRDSVSPDFKAGTRAGTYVSETDDGEVILAPQIGTEFSGTALEEGWITVPWSPEGNAIVDNGLLRVQGARVGTCVVPGCLEQAQYPPGQQIQFVGHFTGDAFQHSGFAVTLEAAPWAIFSTKNGGALYARSMTNEGLAEETELGIQFVGSPHLFQINWNADGLQYFVDGNLVATHSVDIAGPMRPMAASDFNAFGGDVIVDWMRLGPYASQGTFESRVFDAQTSVTWRGLQVVGGAPADTTLSLDVRAGDTTDENGVVGSWVPAINVAQLPANTIGRYLQYRARMENTNPAMSPALEDIIISTDSAPVAVNDTVNAAENLTSTFPSSGPGSLLANDTDEDGSQLTIVALTQPAHGSATLQPGGSVSYTPALNYNGDDSFTYTVSDGMFTSSATVSVTVAPVNNRPNAVDNFYNSFEDVVLSANGIALPGVLANDTDQEGDPLTASIFSMPTHGALTLSNNGTFVYVPAANYAGFDQFSYRAFDGKEFSDPATVLINLAQINDAPIGTSDSYAMVRNQTLTVNAPGVLRNDRDVEVEDLNPLKAIRIPGSGPLHGAFSLAQDGSFTYTPSGDYIGPDTFAYWPEDHLGARGMPVIVLINVNIKAVNEEVAAGGELSTGGDATADDPVQSGIMLPSGTGANVSISQGVISGSFTPPTGYTFLNQQVTILALDAQGEEISAGFANPLVVNFLLDGTLVPPGQNKDTVQIFRNGVIIPDCLGATTILNVSLDPCVTNRENGAALNGDVRFTILTSHASDWNVGIESATITPFSRDDGFMGYENLPLVAGGPGILGNDFGGATLSAIVVDQSSLADAGTLDLNSTGGFTFTPNPGFFGARSFTYKASQDTAEGGTLEGNIATVTLVITPINQPPTFTAGANQAVNEDAGPQSVSAWATSIGPGRPIEEGQALLFATSNDNPGLFSTAPFVAADGTLTYTAAPDAFGSSVVTVLLIDDGGTENGGDNTSEATFTVTVNPVNDAPSFVKGLNQSMLEDTGAQAILWATSISAGPANESGQSLNFEVSNNNPVLFSVQPAIASNGTLTYDPAPNANGTATVLVTLRDNGGTANGGVDASGEESFTITVNLLNDEPTFTGGANQTVNEDAGAQSVPNWATNLSAGPNDESGQALTFSLANDNLDLFSAGPAISPDGTLTFTPAPNAFGIATVMVTMTDNGGTANGGDDTSSTYPFTITVDPVNDAPAFAKGADQTAAEDAGLQTVNGWATGIGAGAANEAGQVLSFVVTNDNPALFSMQPVVDVNGQLRYESAANLSGSATVTVTLNDDGGTANGGDNTSDTQTFAITIALVNDAPSFTAGANQTVNEDAGPQTVVGWATNLTAGPADEAAQSLAFSVSNDNSALFSAQPSVAINGTLTFTPAANASGSATVSVSLTDNGGTANGGDDTSNTATFTINVNSVNDEPSYTAGANQAVNEDAGPQTVAWATAISPGPGESGQAVSFSVTNNNGALFSAAPVVSPTGVLTYTPAANATGVATVTVSAQDNGGTANGGDDASDAQTFTITVSTVNDEPSFTAGANQTVNEDVAAQTIANWATNLSRGPADESAQTLAFTASNNNAALFSAQPSVSPTGTLTFTPAPNANGSATVTVTLTDNGGTANGGDDTGNAATFTITVNVVNDAPIFTKGANQTAVVNSGAKTLAGWATAISAGAANESGQVLTFATTNTNNALFSSQPAVASNGTLTFTPSAITGTATVTVTLGDNGGTANGGVNVSAAQTFTITTVKGTTATTVTSSNLNALNGTSVTFTATVTPLPAGSLGGGTVTFKRGTTTMGTGAVNAAGVATYTTTTLANGTHSVTAVYGGTSSYLGSTSPAISQVISPSAKIQVNFRELALQDNTRWPRLVLEPVAGAVVRVFRRWEPCAATQYVSILPWKWGKVFDGTDGPGGQPGCTPVTFGSYTAEGVTDANGNVTIVVPPTTNHPNIDYLVIGRSLDDNGNNPIYAAYLIPQIQSGQTKKAPLHSIRLFNGKRVAGAVLEEFGSYLAMVQPEEMEWTEEQTLYPVILIAEGAWDVSTSVATPSGFVADEPMLSAEVADTVSAMQFTIDDIGSEWTPTTVTHVIKHNGETRIRNLAVPMINRKKTKAKIDYMTVDPGSSANMLEVLVNDNVAPPKTLTITGVTSGVNGGSVSIAADAMTVLYTPPAAEYVGIDEFTYTILDSEGAESTGTVKVRINTKPSLVINDISIAEGNQGSATALFTVTLSSPSENEISFDFESVDNEAVAGTDFSFASGTATLKPGQTTKTVKVQIIGNTAHQKNRRFDMKIWLDAANKSNAKVFGGSGKANIVDDDPKPQLASSNVTVVEGHSGATLAIVTVTLTGETALPASVNYATSNNSAQAGSDYAAASGTLTFAPGETSKTIELSIDGDTAVEDTEMFTVVLNGAVDAANTSNVKVTIIDDDSTQWVHTTVGDFQHGTVDAGSYISRTNNGEIILAPTLGTEFLGTEVPAGWTSTPTGAGGATTVGDKWASLDGASLVGGAAEYDKGRNLEFEAVFTGVAGQWGGFSGTGAATTPFAMIGTGVANTLVARTVSGSTVIETPLAGNFYNDAQKFRIEWNANKIIFYVNDKKLATHNVAVSALMQPTMVDETVGSGVLAVGYVRMTPYAAAGNYTSAVFDAGGVVNWLSSTWAGNTPAGTAVVVQYRTGNTPTPDATWTSYTTVAGSGGALTGSSRYLQFTVNETTSDPRATPIVKDLTLAFSR